MVSFYLQLIFIFIIISLSLTNGENIHIEDYLFSVAFIVSR